MLALQDTPEAADSVVLAELWHRLRTARERVNNRSAPPMVSDTVRFFLAALGDTCVLAKDEEVLLARIWRGRLRIEAARAELAAESPPNAPPASREAVAARLGLRSVGHLALLEANCQAARELFLQHNLRLVFSVAKAFVGRGMELQELMQEGIVGLERALCKFDPARGFKFSTYAHWWIRQAIARSLNEQTRIVRLPVHISDAVGKIIRAEDELGVSTSTANAAAADDAIVIGKRLGLAPAKVTAYRRASRPHRSLDAPTNRLEGPGNRPPMYVGDVLPCATCDEPGHVQDEVEGAALLRADLNAMLGTLQPRERNVLRLRYGLHRADGRAMSNAEISAAYGVTRERIRQIEDAAFAKLRGPLRRSMLRVGLYFRHPPVAAPGAPGPPYNQELTGQPGLESFTVQPGADIMEQLSAARL